MTHTIESTDIPSYLADPAAQAAVIAGWRRKADDYRSHAYALGLSERHQQALLADAALCEREARHVAFMSTRLRNLKAAA